MSLQKLTVVARSLVKEEKRELVKAEMIKLIAPTRAEEGCINYDLHQDNENPNFFMFYENWSSRELWQAHVESAHIAAYRKATEGCIEEFTLDEMTHIA
ncbi:MAG: antibiotic biosynthesis monooxygenase [Cytophagales bacterium]|nr:antibiotic biosynthesis monooxygenase [Cytophagales bacterium]